MLVPSSVGRESTTLLSSKLQNGHFIVLPPCEHRFTRVVCYLSAVIILRGMLLSQFFIVIKRHLFLPCPPGGSFSAPADRGTRTALACSPLTGGFFSASADRGTRTALACSPLTGGFFSAPADRGTRTALACSPLTGGFFSAPAERGTRTALACSPLTGRAFFAKLQQGIRRLQTAGACRAPRRGRRRTHGGGQKGRTTCGFPSSLDSYLSIAS